MTTGHKGVGKCSIVYEEASLLPQLKLHVRTGHQAHWTCPVVIVFLGVSLPVMLTVYMAAHQVHPGLAKRGVLFDQGEGRAS